MRSFKYLLTLGLFFNSVSNILLEHPDLLSSLDIEKLTKEWETQFSWIFRKGFTFTCYYNHESSGFILRYWWVPLRSYKYPYISETKKLIQYYTQKQPSYYWTKPLHIDKPTPQKITFDELCKLLKNKHFIFYTGAGISAASNVQTMDDLEKALKIKPNKKEFIKTLYWNPQSITQAFTDFCKTAINAQSTDAHYALHQIAQSKNVSILTENVDLLQHRTGSKPIFINSSCLYTLTIKDFQEIDFIICVGLSHDDRGFLAHYKKNNPQGIFIAIDFNLPSYLSSKDFIIHDDLQVLLPALARKIC